MLPSHTLIVQGKCLLAHWSLAWGNIHESQSCICLHTHHSHFIGYPPVHSYLAITLPLGRSELGSYRGPHTFSLGVSARLHAAVWNLGLYHGPHTFHPRCLRSSWSGLILLHREDLSDFKILYHHVDLGEITATDYIERENCGILLAILHLDFYVWSFYAFLLDSSIYTNSLWWLRLSS